MKDIRIQRILLGILLAALMFPLGGCIIRERDHYYHDHYYPDDYYYYRR